MDQFLKFLAVNNTIVAWDTYGYIAHNFYLYNHSSKKLTWVPWDLDLAFNKEPAAVGEVPRVGQAASFAMNEVDSYWPLIRYVMDDPVYYARYRTILGEFNRDVFTQAAVDALVDKYHNMVAPYAIGPNGELPKRTHINAQGDFTASRASIKAHVAGRRATIAEFLR